MMPSIRGIAVPMSNIGTASPLPIGINTLNESALHRTLKMLYSLEDGDRTEVSLDGKVYDIVNGDGGIVEIQTRSVSSLLGKIETAINAGHNVKVVHPVARVKAIEYCDKDKNLIQRKTSPIHLCVYNMWKEITGLTSVLLNKSFALEVLEIAMTEQRLLYDEPVQSRNGRRRYRKPWNKIDKRLDKVLRTYTFTSPAHYIALLPDGLPQAFCAKDVAAALHADKSLPSSAAQQAGYMLWVLLRLGLIEAATPCIDGKSSGGNTKYYKLPDHHD